MKEQKHKFVFAERRYDRNIFLVYCPRHKGAHFSTEVWVVKDIQKNMCPICKRHVKECLHV